MLVQFSTEILEKYSQSIEIISSPWRKTLREKVILKKNGAQNSRWGWGGGLVRSLVFTGVSLLVKFYEKDLLCDSQSFSRYIQL